MAIAGAVNDGAISEGESAAAKKFIGLQGNAPSMNIWIMASQGKLQHLAGEEGYEAAMKVMSAIGLDGFKVSRKTAAPAEQQFWYHFDQTMQLSQDGLKSALPVMTLDANNKAAVEALLSSRQEQEKLN